MIIHNAIITGLDIVDYMLLWGKNLTYRSKEKSNKHVFLLFASLGNSFKGKQMNMVKARKKIRSLMVDDMLILIMNNPLL